MGKVNTAEILKTMLFLKINRAIKMASTPANVMSREPVIRIESDIIVDITFFVWYYYYTENEQKGLLDL
ncbi:MAG: hypothetical protein LBL24_05640, partial [Bacteroidales bacterium]|nr:hypothetical protein [Bacteroidales bacterium]